MFELSDEFINKFIEDNMRTSLYDEALHSIFRDDDVDDVDVTHLKT